MSDLIGQLAKIDFDEALLVHADVNNIYRDFNRNYKKLDQLKNFRSEFEDRNFVSRWWNSDELQTAQLDSAEVQAEFSKTIGQLMLISIAQSKKLTEQQLKMNAQQNQLSNQAAKLEKQAGELSKQQIIMLAQNKQLENLVNDYFKLKGLTRDGAEKLIEIAKDVQSTKEKLINTFNEQSALLQESMQRSEKKTQQGLEIVLKSFDEVSQSILQTTTEQKIAVDEMLSKTIDTAAREAENSKQFVLSKVIEIEKASDLKLTEFGSQMVVSNQKVAEVKDTLGHITEEMSLANKNSAATYQRFTEIAEKHEAEISASLLSLDAVNTQINEQKTGQADLLAAMSEKFDALHSRLNKVACVAGGLGLSGLATALVLHFQR